MLYIARDYDTHHRPMFSTRFYRQKCGSSAIIGWLLEALLPTKAKPKTRSHGVTIHDCATAKNSAAVFTAIFSPCVIVVKSRWCCVIGEYYSLFVRRRLPAGTKSRDSGRPVSGEKNTLGIHSRPLRARDNGLIDRRRHHHHITVSRVDRGGSRDT